MSSPYALLEKSAYKQILRGVSAILLFTIILLAPHVMTLIQLTLEDTTNLADEDQIEQSSSQNSCDSGSENYDAEKCQEEIISAMVSYTIFQIVFYSILIYGLVQIYGGVSKLSLVSQLNHTGTVAEVDEEVK